MRNGTLYTGSTSDLIMRTWEHKNQVTPGSMAKSNVHILLYYEIHTTYVETARREKRFENWPTQWKLNLIEKMSPYKLRNLFLIEHFPGCLGQAEARRCLGPIGNTLKYVFIVHDLLL